MERIAGRTVAVRAEQRILLRVGQIAIAVENGLHRIALTHAGALVFLVEGCHVTSKLHKVGRADRAPSPRPSVPGRSLLHSRNKQIVRKRVLFRVRVFAAVGVFIQDCIKCLVLFVKFVVLALYKILSIYFCCRSESAR